MKTETYPSTEIEKKAVEYVKSDPIAYFVSDDDRMIFEHFYIKGAQAYADQQVKAEWEDIITELQKLKN